MLKNQIIENNGATLNKKGEMVQLKSGYQVSKRDCLKIPVQQFTNELIEKILAFGLKRGEYAGFWIDNGYIYGDISVRIATKKSAVEMGKQLHQIAVWDWKNNKNVLCKA